MKRVIAGPIAVFVLMVLGSLVSATANAQSTWPMGVHTLLYGDLPTWPPDEDVPVLTRLSPVITAPPNGGQCSVTCQIATMGDLYLDPSARLHVELRNNLFDSTGTRRFPPEWTPIAYIDIEGQKDGSTAATWVYSLRGGQSYRFGCTIQTWWRSSDVIGLGGSVSWVCAGAPAGRSVLNKDADGSR